MPKLTPSEEKALDRLSNHIYDVLFQQLDLSEEIADKITTEVIALIMRKAEGKE